MPHIATNNGARRSGLTLAELLIASAIMSMMAAALGVLANAVRQSQDHVRNSAAASQHARVALSRIKRAALAATANEQFPGLVVFSEAAGAWSFPDTLVVWAPVGPAASPNGLPLFSELLIFCPDPQAPERLLEISVRTDTRETPPLTDLASWQSSLAAIKASASAKRVQLTDLLRTAAVDQGGGARRGVVRFEQTLHPSDNQLADVRDGVRTWGELPWVQGIYGTQFGLRQAACRMELQLISEDAAGGEDVAGQASTPYFGSAALYYTVRQ